MSEVVMPPFLGPGEELARKRWARAVVAREMLRDVRGSIELIAQGEIDPISAIFTIRAIASRTIQSLTQQRKQRQEDPVHWLKATTGIPRIVAQRLVTKFGTIEAIADSTLDDLQEVPGIGKKRARVVLQVTRQELGMID